MEGAPHMARKQLMCLEVPPRPVYKGGRGEEAGLGRAKWRGIPLGLVVLFAPTPLSFYQRGKGGRRGSRRRNGGADDDTS